MANELRKVLDGIKENRRTYNQLWDLRSIPEPIFQSEASRRRKARDTKPPANRIMKPCPGQGGKKCGLIRTASQTRDVPCPKCGYKEGRSKYWLAKKERDKR